MPADLVRAAHPAVIVSDRVADAGRVQAWVCGSGLGTDDRAVTELRAVLATPVPVVLDADALTMIADGRTPQTADLLRARAAPLVVTPHDREFARLAGARTGADRVESALSLAAKMRRPCCSRATVRWSRRRTGPPGSTRPVRRRSPPAAPATSWPACSARCSRPGCRADRAAVAGGVRARAGRPGGRAAVAVTAADVAVALRWRSSVALGALIAAPWLARGTV